MRMKNSWIEITQAAADHLIRALTDLYDLDEGGIPQQNWERFDAEIRRRHSNDRWRCEVLDRGGIARFRDNAFKFVGPTGSYAR